MSMMGMKGGSAGRGLGDSKIFAELESLLGKRPDSKNRAVRWSDLDALRKSMIKAGGAGTLDGVAPEGDDAAIPSVPGSLGDRLARRLELAERELDAAEEEARLARQGAQNALSALENAGTIYRAANIVTLPDGSRTAGMEAYVWDDEGGGTGSAMLLFGDQVMAPGTLSANTLVAGFGNNFLQNSRFYDGILHWRKGGNAETTGAVREAGLSFAHPSFRTLMLYQNGPAAGESWFDYAVQQDGTTTRIPGAPCTPGKWYGISAHLRALRTRGCLAIRFMDSSGALIPEGGARSPWVDPAGTPNFPDSWPRAFVKGQAPAGAAYLTFRAVHEGTEAGSPDSYLFIWKPMGEETHAAATAPGAYASGETSLMTGDMIYSRSIMGRHLTVDEAVITGTAQMGNAVVGTLAIGDNQVTIPASQTLGAAESGSNSWVVANSLSYTLPFAGAITVIWFGNQGFDSLSRQSTGFRLVVNGDVVHSIGGDGAARIETDYLSFGRKVFLSAGTHTIAVQWWGAGGVTLYSRTLIVDGAMR